MVTKRGTRNIASILRFPDRHPEPSPTPRGGKNNRRFAAAMAQVRRPVPFRTRKLRPGTAMVLHPRGCGRVARRRIHRQGPPVEHHAPGGPRISAPTPPAHHVLPLRVVAMRSQCATHHPLFVVRCSLFVVHCSLFTVHCLLVTGHCGVDRPNVCPVLIGIGWFGRMAAPLLVPSS